MRIRLVVAALLTTLCLSAAAVPATPSVLVLGDSYASGEGLPDAEGTCGTEGEQSWGALVATELDASDLQLLACSGAEVADLTVGDGGPAQLAQARPADLVLLSIAGNDLGFTSIVADCLGFAELDGTPAAGGDAGEAGSWSDLLTGERPDVGCDVSEEELLGRVADFAAADRFVVGPDGATGGLSDVYVAVAERVLAPGGRLLVVGYPALFAEVATWPERYGQRCHGLRATDAAPLARVVVALDDAVATAVDAANDQLGDDRVGHVSLLGAYDGSRDGEDHRLCGTGRPWMNGLTVTEGGVDVARLLGELGAGPGGLDLERLGARPSGSFHPGTAGHRGTADTVVERLEGT